MQFWRTKCPHVVRISSATKRTAQEVLGFLADLWSWASSESDDGILHGVTISDLVPMLGGDEKLWVAVAESGWLVIGATYLQIPNWDHWLSKSAKRRTKDSLRKKMSRNCPQNVPELSASDADKSALQERREEKNKDIGVGKPTKPEKPKQKSKPVFIVPTVEEVSAYCLERGNSIDPQRFVDHYTSNGWVVGKAKMKDWRAAVRTWEKNDVQRNGKPQPPKPMTRAEIDAIAQKMNEDARREAHNPELENATR